MRTSPASETGFPQDPDMVEDLQGVAIELLLLCDVFTFLSPSLSTSLRVSERLTGRRYELAWPRTRGVISYRRAEKAVRGTFQKRLQYHHSHQDGFSKKGKPPA
jgi:hypothetical protein